MCAPVIVDLGLFVNAAVLHITPGYDTLTSPRQSLTPFTNCYLMRIVRFQARNEPIRYGWILDEAVGPIEGDPFGEFHRLETDRDLASVRLLAPVLPSKIICVGRNYVAHAREHDAVVPDLPLLFLKPPSSVIGPEDKIILPPQSQQVEHEAELVVIIGQRGRWIPAESALDYVLGYTVGNDVTARDLQRRDGQWTRSK